MKILNDEKFALLSAQADAFTAIQTAMVEASDGVKPEEITADSIIEALQADTDESELVSAQTQLTETQTLLTSEQSALATANDRITALEAEVKTLGGFPADNPASISSKGEPDGEPMTIAQFADKNKGNTQAILAMALKDGLI